jgi:1-acyl-sn-glycerol-3-phosphate acyltransferase
MKRETLRKIIHYLLHTFSRVEYCGCEHLPPEGPVIVATNHMSRMDTLFLFINPARTDITALVADKYLKYPIFNLILKSGGVIWLDRDKADFGAFRKAREVLKEGVSLGIAPEGTRSRTGQLLEGKPGTAMLAASTQTPVVPVGIAGTDTFFKDLLHFRKPRVRVSFGPALHLAPLERDTREAQLNAYTEEIMCYIAALLPPRYWGYYQDHPRVEELAEGFQNN